MAVIEGILHFLIQKQLGHSKASVTLDTYGHALEENNRAVANVMGAALYADAKPQAEVRNLRKTA